MSFQVLDAYGKSAIGSYTATVEAAATSPITTTPAPTTTSNSTTTAAAVVSTGTTAPTTPALAYTGLQVGTALGVVLALLIAGATMTAVARRPRKRGH